MFSSVEPSPAVEVADEVVGFGSSWSCHWSGVCLMKSVVVLTDLNVCQDVTEVLLHHGMAESPTRLQVAFHLSTFSGHRLLAALHPYPHVFP